MLKLTLILGLALAPGVLHAQSAQRAPAPIETDRPDFIESSVVVPRGYWQLENGALYARRAGLGAFRGSESLLRVSINDRWEWRVGLPSVEWEHGPGAGATWHGDAYAGAKFQVGPVGAWDIAVIPGTSVPVGSDGRSTGTFDPELKVTWARELGAGIGFSGMLDTSWPGDNGTRTSNFEPALSLAREVAPRLRLFIEWVGSYGNGETSGHLAHAGLAWRVTDHVQLDTHAARRIAGDFPDTFVAFGVSFRRGPGRAP